MTETELLAEVPAGSVRIDSPFWNGRLETNTRVTLPHQFEELERSGRLENFRRVASNERGGHQGMNFNDSDVYKWLEAACWTLIVTEDAGLRERVKYVASLINQAQGPDGYINTYIALEEPHKRWTNLGMVHELYCAGHLFEAAAAHHRAFGTEELLSVACRFADLIDTEFRVGGRKGVPGHEEIEIGLIELYRRTYDSRYLELAKLFLNRRGTKDSTFRDELRRLPEIAGHDFRTDVENFDTGTLDGFYRYFYLNERGEYDGSYAQDHVPIRQQRRAVGHAVRGTYLYTAMADLILEDEEARHDHELRDVLQSLWESVTERQMYVTGGVGSSGRVEGFSEDYDLPNADAYAETCAAVGMMLWSDRMLKLTGESRFGDIMERVLFNGFLAGVSRDGKSYFYVNPLSSEGAHRRQGWFNVACCPTNVVRFMPRLGRYLYYTDAETRTVTVNLYVAGEMRFQSRHGSDVLLRQSTDFPWDGTVRFDVSTSSPVQFALRLRVPDWCSEPRLAVNGEAGEVDSVLNDKGFAVIDREWQNGDFVELELPMSVERVKSHPAVEGNAGRVALQRGPIVYCIEQADNAAPLDMLMLPAESAISARFQPDLLGGTTVLEGSARGIDAETWKHRLYQPEEAQAFHDVPFTAVPYHLWGHREPGPMRVWVKSSP